MARRAQSVHSEPRDAERMSAEDLRHGLRIRLLLQPLEAQLPELTHLLVGLPIPVRRGLLFAQALLVPFDDSCWHSEECDPD